MLFNSLGFLYGFLPAIYLVFWRFAGKTQRWMTLAIGGYVFYSFWNYKFLVLMLFSTGVSYLAGLALLRWQDPGLRRWCVAGSVGADLAVLGFFKYGNFMAGNINAVTSWLGGRASLPILDIVLPVGISFYTFHTITYVIDAYRGAITPTRNLFKYAAYVSMFPQLVAGPIVRYRQIEQDFENVDRAHETANADTGWSFFVVGLVEKVLIADTIASIIDPALARYSELSTVDAWLCVVGFAYQVYFDFAGYSDMAVGLGHLFGFRIPQNFNSPYKSTDIADMWRRWHISLSSFFRDYVYIPLGGSRGGRLLTYRNLMLTMLLCGLWHGASWIYVTFGAYQGVLLILTSTFRGTWERLPLAARRIGTFGVWVVGLAIFRSSGFPMAGAMFQKMFTWHAGTAVVGGTVLVGMLTVAAGIAHFGPNSFEMHHRWSPGWVGAIAIVFGLCLFMLYGSRPAPYLYFQF